MIVPGTPDMNASTDGESPRVATIRTTSLPVRVDDRPDYIALFVGDRKVASAWGPATDDPVQWFWWNGRTEPYRIGGAIYDEPALDGRVAAAGLIEDEREKWQRHEASLYHPDHGPLIDDFWVAVGPAGVSCWGCGEPVECEQRVTTVVLGEDGDLTRHYVCANCEVWLDDEDDETSDTRSSTGGTQ